MGEISADKARIGKFGCEILEFLHGGVAETDGFDGNDRPRGEHIPHDAGPHESGAPKIVTIISLPPEPAMPNSQTCSCTAFLKKSGA